MVKQFQQFLAGLPSLALNLSKRSTPPCFVAWVDGPPTGTLDMGTDAQVQLGASLLVVWLDIEDTRRQSGDPIDIAIYQEDAYAGGNYGYAYAGGPVPTTYYRRIDSTPLLADGSDWKETSIAVGAEDELSFRLDLPSWVRGNHGYHVEVTVTTEPHLYEGLHGAGDCSPDTERNYRSGFTMSLLHQEANSDAPLLDMDATTRPLSLGSFDGLAQTTYRIEDWNQHLTPRSVTLPVTAHLRSENGRPLSEIISRNYSRMRARGELHFHAHIRAQLVKTSPESMGD